MATFNQGGEASLDVLFKETEVGPFIDPPDARFDILDPNGVTVESDTPTTIILSPGRHRGVWSIPVDALVGTWTMRFKATIDGNDVQEDCTFIVNNPVVGVPGSYGPCQAWPIDMSCANFPSAANASIIARWRMVATELLWAESGRIYGPCVVTARPCLRSCGEAGFLSVSANGLIAPIQSGWFRTATCGCGGDCSCGSLCEIALEGPVAQVDEVRIDGVAVTDWKLQKRGDQTLLVRTGEGCWPSCQDMRAGPDEEGSFVVTYQQGLPVPYGGIAAVSELTSELVRACLPNCECRIPKNVQAKTRAGQSITFDTSQPWIRALPLVGAWLKAVNPRNLDRPMRVMSPDVRPGRRDV